MKYSGTRSHVNSLNHILQINEFNESLPDGEVEIIKHSPYFTDEELIDKIKNKQNTFVVLSLNCQSLNAKMDQINMKLENLRKTAVKLEPFVYKKHGYPMTPTFLCCK